MPSQLLIMRTLSLSGWALQDGSIEVESPKLELPASSSIVIAPPERSSST